MKTSLLQHLVCPACAGILSLSPGQIEYSKNEQAWDEVISGTITCGQCHESYPIIGGVPRMLLGHFKLALTSEYPELFAGTRSTATPAPLPDKVLETMRSFGYEWRHFSDIRPEGIANFRHYFGDNPATLLADKVVLDAGCGKGRHVYHACAFAKFVVGVDLSAAVDAAFANTRHLPNAHIVQADLFRLPFRKQSFDVVYSLGVLHHLPTPETGFRTIVEFAQPGGFVRVYLYWSMTNQPAWKRGLMWVVTQIRKVTTRLPFPLLRLFSWIVASVCATTLVLSYRILRRTPLRTFAETIPLKTYADFPFRCLYQDQFDRFSAPIENRYTQAQVAQWLEHAGLTNCEVKPAAGWIASGHMPFDAERSDTNERHATQMN